MPIYEYACIECKLEFEQVLKVNDPAPECPDCENPNTEKKISLGAFHLQGKGWYADGYAGPSNKNYSK